MPKIILWSCFAVGLVSFSMFVLAVLRKPKIVLDMTAWRPGLPLLNKIWFVTAFIGSIGITFFAMQGSLGWMPESWGLHDENGWSSYRDMISNVLAVIAGFGSMAILIEFARMRHETPFLQYMLSATRDAIRGNIYERKIIVEELKKSIEIKGYTTDQIDPHQEAKRRLIFDIESMDIIHDKDIERQRIQKEKG